MGVLKHALIKDGIVQNVILLDPDVAYTPPDGCECIPCGEGPNTGDPKTRRASHGDRAVKVRGARAKDRPYDFEPAPKPEPVAPEPTLEERIAALEAMVQRGKV